jgi:hypothetical protein
MPKFIFLCCLEVAVLWLESTPAKVGVGAMAKADFLDLVPWPFILALAEGLPLRARKYSFAC